MAAAHAICGMRVRCVRDDAAVMNGAGFVDLLTERVPEAVPTVREHLADNDGDLLLHLLLADLRRLAVAWFDQGFTDPLQRLLAVVDDGLAAGDDRLENAVAVSFVEDAAWWEPSSVAFIATWPNGLANEVQRQRTAHK
jgi:hypothetical protein